MIELKREPEYLNGSFVQEEVAARWKDSKSRDRWVMDSGWAVLFFVNIKWVLTWIFIKIENSYIGPLNSIEILGPSLSGADYEHDNSCIYLLPVSVWAC